MSKVKLVSKDSQEVEFIVKKKKKDGTSKLVLKTSKSGSWCEDFKDKTLVEIEDLGDGIKIKSEGGGVLSLHYAEFESLYLAMTEHILTEPNLMPEYERLVKV